MSSLSLLIIEDNHSALKNFTDLLKSIGIKNVYPAKSANDAWSIMKIQDFDCVISAWDMPDMSGLALLRIVRNDDKLYNIPFFLTHSAFTKVTVIQAGQSGVTGLFVKPFDKKNLKLKLASLALTSSESEFPETENNLEKGLDLIENGNYEDALDVFEKLVEEGETAEYYYNIGYIKTSQGQYAEAIEAFRKATQLDRLFAKAFEAMGRAYQKLGRDKEAEKCMQKAADIYMSKDQVQHAEALLNEILEGGSNTINIYNSLGVLYRKKGEFETALKQYEKAIKIHPDKPHIYYNVGRLYIDMNQPEKAIDFFKNALKVDPNFKEAQDVLNALELGSA